MKKLTQQDIDEMLPVITDNLLYEKKVITDAAIKRSLYKTVIYSLADKENFAHEEEKPELPRVHLL